jgi:hypothetical protein
MLATAIAGVGTAGPVLAQRQIQPPPVPPNVMLSSPASRADVEMAAYVVDEVEKASRAAHAVAADVSPTAVAQVVRASIPVSPLHATGAVAHRQKPFAMISNSASAPSSNQSVLFQEAARRRSAVARAGAEECESGMSRARPSGVSARHRGSVSARSEFSQGRRWSRPHESQWRDRTGFAPVSAPLTITTGTYTGLGAKCSLAEHISRGPNGDWSRPLQYGFGCMPGRGSTWRAGSPIHHRIVRRSGAAHRDDRTHFRAPRRSRPRGPGHELGQRHRPQQRGIRDRRVVRSNLVVRYHVLEGRRYRKALANSLIGRCFVV